jgi:predicted dehydrogenase
MTQAPLRFGILGAANIARQFVAAVKDSPALRVAAVASRDDAKARAFASEFGLRKHYAHYKELLNDPSIDVIYVPLPNHLHAEWAIKALEHGKHVLCEKPLCMGLAQARAMYAASKLYRRMLLEAYPYWYQPQTRDMLHLVHGGAIGQVRMIQASFGFTLAKPEGNIRFDPDKGGGALLDAGSYPISLVRLLMGDAPLRVHASPSWSDSGVDIAMAATLEFSQGRRAQISCAMNVANHRRAVVSGTNGTIETEYLNHTSPQLPSQLRVRRGVAFNIPFEDIQSAHGSGFRFAAEAFVEVIRRQDFAALARAERASLDIAQTLEAIAQSARSGQAVTLTQHA